MNLVSVNDLGKSMSGRLLFEGLSFGIDSDDRIAVVGRNGCGKSTLLRLIAGYTEPDSGSVAKRRDLKVVSLEQSPVFDNEDKIIDFILTGDSVEIKLIREYEALVSGAGEYTKKESERMVSIMSEMDNLDCWNLQSGIHSILNELGITDLEQKVSELSGGMLKKVALAKTLATDSGLMILDEPTNHLDIPTINWLEKFINNSRSAVILVTHDRYLIDSVCGKIFEIDDQKLYIYEGNYSKYLFQKTRRTEIEAKTIARLNNILRNEAEWIKRGPRARAGKDKKRKERFVTLREEVPTQKVESDKFSVEEKRLGGKIIEVENVSHAFNGKSIINNFSYSFKKGDRIGLLGKNGSGKSTLLNIITGCLRPDKGSVEHGVNTKTGYYDQLSLALPGDMKAIDFINETAEVITLKDGTRISPSQFLERFLFPKELLYTEIKNLSGGEKKKLYLLNILLSNPNFLVFDEPTNDFDIQTLSILEDFLQNFTGCTLIVSHDRFFLDRTTDFLFVLDGKGGVNGYAGDVMSFYSPENQTMDTDDNFKPAGTDVSGKKEVNRSPKGLSFKEKKELEKIESDIMLLEAEKDELYKYFASVQDGGAELGRKKNRYDEVVNYIEEKYARWEYLESKNG